MSVFDSILKNMANAPDDVVNVAAKVGIDPGIAEKAIAALGKAHAEPVDTVQSAAALTGLDTGTLARLVEQIGGEGSLAEYARMVGANPQAKNILGMLDQDGDGNPLDDIAGLASGLLGKK
ncbi:hypothetical protein [Qipengyuania soli]|uniref:DUF937 domain-containing protein n=1 Tax=Qipengyuania soli TaxID=2782568 RepID=A0A7S8IV59_9SPHN|nr:hypothetical protein [Qipengyuania soli]QPC99482.1 hypothetical protein IRL76_02605 [Qipengyuania soli]